MTQATPASAPAPAAPPVPQASGWIAVTDDMPDLAEDESDILYCRVVYDDAARPTDRRVGYFDGGEWKDIAGYKFSTYGGTVTHWYAPPELPSGVQAAGADWSKVHPKDWPHKCPKCGSGLSFTSYEPYCAYEDCRWNNDEQTRAL